MIGALCGSFLGLGIIMLLIDILVIVLGIPFASLEEVFNFSFLFKIMGGMFAFIGVIILFARLNQTGAGHLLDIPNSKQVILFHQRRGQNPNVRIMKGQLTDLEFIRTKNKLFKDTGGGFRISGHDCRHTHETICADIPKWLGQYFHQIKMKFMVNNIDDLHKLHEDLQKIPTTENPDGSVTVDLSGIKLLEPVLKVPEKQTAIEAMDLEELQHLSECLFDGTTRHMEDVEDYIESATPNELDALEKQEFLNEIMREKNYSDPGEFNFSKWFPYITTMILVCAVAVVMIVGVLGD